MAAADPSSQPSLFGDVDSFGYGGGAIYDEMVTGHGSLRPHWQSFMRALGPTEPELMGERWEEARRLLRQNGVTYNIYGDPQGMERPWPLDLVPLLIPSHEWKAIEAGLIQRATLLNMILGDLYGPQTLVRSGRVPAALLHADPGFLRSLHGTRPTGGIYLHLYAVDLARASDGRWWVLGDRTQSPSGAGYALENRAVISRVLPEPFRDCRVQRLSPFFVAVRETLARIAPRRDQPRIVLLTPGPYNETYFEHAYLARHLGITLVEGGDLTVRDRAVYLKTLSGLEPVDVILRRLDDNYCDPLELRADSSLGVAGLVQAVRAGTVTVANALGSGIMESASFKPFLPMLCREMLGEELKLPGVKIWWCGSDAERAYVTEHLASLVIKPAFVALGGEPIFGAELAYDDKAALVQRIRHRPFDFVAQERVALSTAPCWQDDKMQPRPLVLRVYLAATADGYIAMPGGLTRMSTAPGRLVVSMQRGGGSKDTWILESRATEGVVAVQPSPGPETRTSDVTPVRGDLPSRVADSLFWLGRYAERADSQVRVLRALHSRLVDGTRPGVQREIVPLVRLARWTGILPWQLDDPTDNPSALRQALQAALFDSSLANSLGGNIQRLRRASAGVRDRLSLDLWRTITQLERLSEAPGPKKRSDSAMLMRLDELVTVLAALVGLEQVSMTRGPGWRFLDLGRRLEGASQLVSILRGTGITQAGSRDEATLEVLLELSDSTMAYRERYFATAQRAAVLDLLLTDDSNPRALSSLLAALAEHLTALPRPPLPPGQEAESPANLALGLVESARQSLRRPALLQDGPALAATLEPLAVSLPEISNLLVNAYFSHAFARPA